MFGEEDCAEVRGRHNLISPSKTMVSVLPTTYMEVMVGLPQLVANNAYNRLITAIEIVESTELSRSTENKMNVLKEIK